MLNEQGIRISCRKGLIQDSQSGSVLVSSLILSEEGPLHCVIFFPLTLSESFLLFSYFFFFICKLYSTNIFTVLSCIFL